MKKQYLPHTWADPALTAKRSSISGTGVFTTRDFKKGETVMIWGGVPVPIDSFDETKYRYQTIVQIDEKTYLALPITDKTESIDEYINHSCDSNTWLLDEVIMIARRDIKAGEEITLDSAMWNVDAEEEYTETGMCTCGSALCRKKITAEDWKKLEVQKQYAGHFSPFIEERISSLSSP